MTFFIFDFFIITEMETSSSFSGCYILRSMNPAYKTHCYIGFTVNPPRRIKQHNGELTGGAFKTHKMRPWEMTLVVWGFPTKNLALKFEWIWQHPDQSGVMKHVNWNELFRKEGGRRNFYANLVVLKEMILSNLWSRLSLKICVQSKDVFDKLHEPPVLPSYIKVYLGKIEDLPIGGSSYPPPGEQGLMPCLLCSNKEEDDPPENQQPKNWVICPNCGSFLHLKCMALRMISETPLAGSALIPVQGTCPSCKEKLMWRDLVEMRNTIPDE